MNGFPIMVCVRVGLFVLLALAPRIAMAAAPATLFRLFLLDGTDLVSFGEYARVGDDVIFSMPIGDSADTPKLQLVTIPAKQIDWGRTDRYSDAARAERYAATRGDDDFAQLNNEVARVLNDLALATDRTQALALAQRAHDVLVQWPQDHYHYRDFDVREIQSFVDTAIAGLRGTPDAGIQIALVAKAPELPREPVTGMPPPKLQLDHLLHVAPLMPRTADRVMLLQAALTVVNGAVPGLSPADAATLRTTIEGQLRHEADVDQQYTRASQRLLADGRRAASTARVAAVERVMARAATEDARLGHARPDMVKALQAQLEDQLNDARRLRLLRDRWTLRHAAYEEYQNRVGVRLLQLVQARPLLESIRRLDGPAPNRLVTLERRLAGGADRLQLVKVPPELQAAHDLLVGAWRFAESATAGRHEAVTSGNMASAWTASSAAAGALMLLTRAQDEIRSLLEFPRLK
jgi:hypothetical protein